MYNNDIVRSIDETADQKFTEKLRVDLRDVFAQKEEAMLAKNFAHATSLQMKEDMLIKNLQKMEGQPSADMLRNCISQWLDGFCHDVNDAAKLPVTTNLNLGTFETNNR